MPFLVWGKMFDYIAVNDNKTTNNCPKSSDL